MTLGKRPPAPIGKACRLVDIGFGDLAHQRFVGGGLTKAANHGRDLGIEERFGNDFCLMMKDFDVLTRGVENLHHLFRGEKTVKRGKVQPFGLRVDNGFAIGAGRLDKAELGPIGPVAHEFGV